jgi:hypothetical protein
VVGPIPDAERGSFLRRVKAGFALLVGLSGGLMALQAEAGAVTVGVATLAGVGLGAALVWLAFPSRSEPDNRSEDRRFR